MDKDWVNGCGNKRKGDGDEHSNERNRKKIERMEKEEISSFESSSVTSREVGKNSRRRSTWSGVKGMSGVSCMTEREINKKKFVLEKEREEKKFNIVIKGAKEIGINVEN